MKQTLWRALRPGLMLIVLLNACSTPVAPPPPTLTEALAATQSVFPPSAESVIASAEAIPAQYARMSFAVSAPVKEVFVKEGDPVKAGQALITLDAPSIELAVTQAEYKLKAAQLDWAYWIPPRKNRPPERRELAWAEVVQAQNQLETANAMLAQATLTAPFDGTIASIDVKPGEITQPGKPVLVLGDLAHMRIETTDLSERDVPNVKSGQSARIFIEALDITVNGKVTSISPFANLVGGDAVYKVIIEPQEQVEGLLWGMSATVDIQTE